MNRHRNYTYTLLILLSGWLGLIPDAHAQYLRPTQQKNTPASRNQVRIKNQPIRLLNDSIMIDMSIRIQGISVEEKRQLVLTPVLSTGNYNKSLPAVVINGKKRHKLYKRTLKLNKKNIKFQPYKVFEAKGDEVAETVHYRVGVPIEPWMKTASLVLEQDLCGCANETQRIAVDMIEQQIMVINEPVLNFDFSNTVVSFIEPPRQQIKNLAESDQAYIVFNAGKSNILPNLANNTEELGKIANSFDFIVEEPTARINNIVITAYASPEGSQLTNKGLSERRAASLLNWIRSTKNLHGIPKVASVGKGEDWETLTKLIKEEQSLTTVERNTVLDIIATTSNLDEREAKIRAYKGGEPYRFIFDNIYPELRRSDYLIEFTVPEFSLEKSLEILKTKPGMLSQAEFYAIANTYQKGSKEFNQVFDIAVRLFPDDQIAILNAAAAELEADELNRASQRLKASENDSRAWNNIGVLLMKQQKVDEAEIYLRRAAESGSRDAERNLKLIPQLKKAIENYKEALEEYRFFNKE